MSIIKGEENIVISGRNMWEISVYLNLGRIPPLLSEAKVGDECRFFTKSVDNK